MEPWFILWNFVLLRLLCISINLPYGRAWISYKNRCVGLLVFEPLTHRRNVASLSLFYLYYFSRCSSELAQLVPLPSTRGRSTHYSDRLNKFSVTIPIRMSMSTVSFHTQLDFGILSIECFPLIYDLNSFKSRINRELLTEGSF